LGGGGDHWVRHCPRGTVSRPGALCSSSFLADAIALPMQYSMNSSHCKAWW
jgi:hypothetical protein